MSSKHKPREDEGAAHPAAHAAEKPGGPSIEVVEAEIPLKRSSSADSVKKALSSLTFITELKESGDIVTASVVETRDIHKNPYLYYEILFKPSEILLKYSVTPEVNAGQRRIEICRNLLGMLSLVGESYGVKLGALYTLVQSALEGASANAGQNYHQLMNKYDALQKEHTSLSSRYNKMKDTHEELNNSFLELEKRSAMLSDRVKQLEGMTDNELREELQRWIFEHDGSIRYSDFAKAFNVPQSRAEEGVNMLLKEGYIIRSD